MWRLGCPYCKCVGGESLIIPGLEMGGHVISDPDMWLIYDLFPLTPVGSKQGAGGNEEQRAKQDFAELHKVLSPFEGWRGCRPVGFVPVQPAATNIPHTTNDLEKAEYRYE